MANTDDSMFGKSGKFHSMLDTICVRFAGATSDSFADRAKYGGNMCEVSNISQCSRKIC